MSNPSPVPNMNRAAEDYKAEIKSKCHKCFYWIYIRLRIPNTSRYHSRHEWGGK